MTKFSGMFIGGNRDGQSQDATQPVIRISVNASKVWGQARWSSQQSGHETPDTQEYTHLSLWGFDHGFWIPSEEAEKGLLSANSYVIDELTRRYAEKT